jgi:DNA mismatch repair protein MutS2
MNDHQLREGDTVTIVAIKKDGVISEVLGGGRYRVVVGSLHLTCSSRELAPSEPAPPKPRLTERKVLIINQPKPPHTLDLHGLIVDEAIRKLDQWLNAVILSELYQVKVVHGLGTGRVQSAVHDYLRTIKAVRHFKINEWNAGETDVYL